ncbi:CoA-acylating methylmalonate-semialdehyde dehydrogenase [Truepera radiovictrix]|uniref:methylmalonate-semialdehyde dehydrogenase (CoA acylating) n=1 Tax=Truepera radiovictrix (strain DSM 17093 / CIP 108686 / LMG 22925 / RQ-24) TaxID=649638 RepID=D7CWF1_TRURR|nr:CoA-acylating methylmalonate-semialdehyde dehydrogenase [Truepera radiovictrix]ADI14350.1 methylmalonate-semialdehyde dehydrogenase [Truepera radiovictrix DSM 17093]WMT57093.1 CoA-acylating methylmalonate-semialdehyde dehydrogenase [Truepera radiovictrix]
MTTTASKELLNYIGGSWTRSKTRDYLDVHNPATAEVIARAPLSAKEEVDSAVKAALEAFGAWRMTPVTERVQPLFKLKALIEANLDELARTITLECGKTYKESLAEMQRGVENLEVACGMPTLIQGTNNEDIARGIDEHMFRQPLGVVAAITPFNFPGMIPLWFLPYAVAAGNCFLLKPSEKVPMTTQRLYGLAEEAGFPKGVLGLVNGGKDTVDAILDHPDVRAVSFVGSTPVAKYIYSRATKSGKRAQCQGGAKNPAVVLPDADMEMTTRILADSAFGCAGQRCLATSVAITVGDAREEFTERIVADARSRKVGFGLDEDVVMGPVISAESKARIEGLVEAGVQGGARVLVDGRGKEVDGFRDGYFVHPTVVDEVDPNSTFAHTEIFGPVLSMMHANTVEEAIELVNARAFGNQACLFTSSGAAARRFRYAVRAGNVGINLGVAAPMAFFPFSGWGESFFGDLHAQGRHGVEFYTETKVVVERWPKEWSRTF